MRNYRLNDLEALQDTERHMLFASTQARDRLVISRADPGRSFWTIS